MYFNTQTFKDTKDQIDFQLSNRMVYSFLILTLAKWMEFYKRYKSVIPKSMRPACKIINVELDNRQVKQFRNEVVGHIWNQNHRRPLLPEEINNMAKTLIKDDTEQFIRWVDNPPNNHFGQTMLGTIAGLRDEIKKKWSLSDHELFPQDDNAG